MFLLLVIGIVLYLSSAKSIVVEDNTITYFKLPTLSVLNTLGCNTGKLSGNFILKCPRSTPGSKVESMKTCAIVNEKHFAQKPVKPFWKLLGFSDTEQSQKQSNEKFSEALLLDGVNQKSLQEYKHRRRGQAVKGYHNIYHRDEFVQDHIFYDDLDHSGGFSNHGKSLEAEEI